MAYVEFNGVQLTTQPTEIIWQKRDILGYDGNGHAIYAPYRAAQLKWDLLSVDDFSVIRTAYANQGTTGSVVVALPKWSGSTFSSYGYTGCVLEEPEVDAYFMESIQKITLLVTRIVG
jgi:hypothetical protein